MSTASGTGKFDLEWVSRPSPGGSSDGYAQFATMSADGSFIAFTSTSKLVPGLAAADPSDVGEAYIWTVDGGLTLIGDESQPNYWNHFRSPDMSADGQTLVFDTRARLSSADTDDWNDVYLWRAGEYTLISRSTLPENGSLRSFGQTISADGSTVVFGSDAALTADDVNPGHDLYIWTAASGVRLISKPLNPGMDAGTLGSSGAIRLSADGSTVVFSSSAQLTATDRDEEIDLYMWRMGENVRLLSEEFTPGSFDMTPDGSKLFLERRDVSPEGYLKRYLYTMDLEAGATPTSIDLQGSSGPAINISQNGMSADGTSIVFSTTANLVSSDTDQSEDVYLRDQSGIHLISGVPGAHSHFGYWSAGVDAISEDGRTILFANHYRDEAVSGWQSDFYVWRKDEGVDLLAEGVTYGYAALSSDGSTVVITGRPAGSDQTTETYAVRLDSAPTVPNPVLGGPGTDWVSFEGTCGSYTWYQTGGEWQFTSIATGGVSVLIDIERVHFSDGILALDVGAGETAGSAYRIYQAAFGRTPDVEGLEYWINLLDGGSTLTWVAEQFVYSAEFISTFGGGISDEEFVRLLYRNVLDREGDPEGVDFWTDALESGRMSKAEVLEGFTESPENTSLVGVSIDDGIFY